MSDSDAESTGSSSSGSSGSSGSSASSSAASKGSKGSKGSEGSSASADGVVTAFPTRRSSRKRVAPGTKKRIPDERLPMITRLQAACEILADKKSDTIAAVERTPTNHVVKYILKNRDHLVTHGIVTWKKTNEYGKRGYVKIFLLDDFTEIDEIMMWDCKLLSHIRGRHMVVFVMNQRRDQGVRFHPDRHEHWLRMYSDGSVGSLSWCRLSWEEVHAAARVMDTKTLTYDLVSEDGDSDEEDSHAGRGGNKFDLRDYFGDEAEEAEPKKPKKKKSKKTVVPDYENGFEMRPAEGGGYSMQVAVRVEDDSEVSDPEDASEDSSEGSSDDDSSSASS